MSSLSFCTISPAWSALIPLRRTIYMNGIYQGFGPPEGVWRYIYYSDMVGQLDADLRGLGNIFVSYELPSVVIYMAYVQPAVSSA
jgi:hypothetical protein